MDHTKPQTTFDRVSPNVCPVCGKSSYSAAGIHPQCAVKQSDQKREAKRKLSGKSPNAKMGKTKVFRVSTSWQKTCPKCKLPQHVRKKTCECGHTLS
jgi:hypothetical protein